MRDQNVTFITEKLTLEAEAWVYWIPEPFCPILTSTSHLGETYFCMLGTRHLGETFFCTVGQAILGKLTSAKRMGVSSL